MSYFFLVSVVFFLLPLNMRFNSIETFLLDSGVKKNWASDDPPGVKFRESVEVLLARMGLGVDMPENLFDPVAFNFDGEGDFAVGPTAPEVQAQKEFQREKSLRGTLSTNVFRLFEPDDLTRDNHWPTMD